MPCITIPKKESIKKGSAIFLSDKRHALPIAPAITAIANANVDQNGVSLNNVNLSGDKCPIVDSDS